MHKCVKNGKYRFGLQKGVKIGFQNRIRIRDHQIVYGYLCYFLKRVVSHSSNPFNRASTFDAFLRAFFVVRAMVTNFDGKNRLNF